MDISYYKLVLDHINVFLACFQKEVHWTPLDHIHIIRLSKVFKQNKIWKFLTKSDDWRDHGLWLVTKSFSPKLREESGAMARAAMIKAEGGEGETSAANLPQANKMDSLGGMGSN